MENVWILVATAAAMVCLPFATAALGADLTPAIVTNLTGSLHIVQEAPCNNTVDVTRALTGGQLRLTPAEGLNVAGGKRFALASANLVFQGFSVSASCGIFSDTRIYSDISIRLARAISFVATPATGGALAVTIPKNDILVAEQAVVNGNPEQNYFNASQDVTGTIDLTHATMHITFVATSTTHFQAGCTPTGCIIDEFKPGTFTADVLGTIVFPDTDGDGVPDRSDNCRFVPNPSQSTVVTPAVTAPDAVTFASCADHAIGVATAADVCDGGLVSVTNDAPATFNPGANVVTWTATDAKGRTTGATQTVTVADTTKPTFTFVPLDVHASDCGVVPLGLATATDDCGGVPGITNDSPGSFLVGTTAVTWTATDASGNISTALQQVIVTDAGAPSVSCVLDSPTGRSFRVTAADACGAPVLTLGAYVIANGEQIKIEEVGQPGVRLQNVVSNDGIRKFLVGKGQGVILATDGSGNTSTAPCLPK